jgi:hypothetical protein
VHDEDKWLINKPVERRSEALSEELNECFGRFWTWVSCGGPAARMRQLYVNGRLSRCWDEYTRFKNCMIGKLNPDQVGDQVNLPFARSASVEVFTVQVSHTACSCRCLQVQAGAAVGALRAAS